MSDRAKAWLGQRLAAFLALLLPCVSGLAFLASFHAPQSYVLINGAAIVAAFVWIAFGRLPSGLAARRALTIALLALLAAPLVAGPVVYDVARWVTVGGFSLHVGGLVLPLLACLAAKDRPYAAPILLTALLITFVQPDAASAFALMLASVGLYFAWHDWKPGVIAIVGFLVGLSASLRGELPPQPFVERIFNDLIPVAPWFALWLGVSVIGALLLMIKALPRPDGERFALAGTLAGFSIIALISNYPSVLIAYGAAPILGYGLAMAGWVSPPTMRES